MPRSVSVIVLAVGLVVCACTDGADGSNRTSAPPVDEVEAADRPSPTPPAIPEEPPPTSGPVAADCVNGWSTPEEGSPEHAFPLRVIRRVTGVRGAIVVVDMRRFEGPESPPSDKGYLLNVRRWYVKAFAERDLTFQGRFLIEARQFGNGLVAVAPYDTNGFRSPDWIGFQFDSADPVGRAYEGLPGRWSGIPYDFVEGSAGLEIPGLPDEVTGCLSET